MESKRKLKQKMKNVHELHMEQSIKMPTYWAFTSYIEYEKSLQNLFNFKILKFFIQIWWLQLQSSIVSFVFQKKVAVCSYKSKK